MSKTKKTSIAVSLKDQIDEESTIDDIKNKMGKIDAVIERVDRRLKSHFLALKLINEPDEEQRRLIEIGMQQLDIESDEGVDV